MSELPITCTWCGAKPHKPRGAINRARKIGAPLYCNKTCAGLARRSPPKSAQQKKAEKAAYDRLYRARNLASIKAKKAAYFKRTYDPVVAAIARKARMPKHVEYCRRPEYKAWKHNYDQQYQARKQYGPAAEAFLAFKDLNREIKSRSSKHEIYQANGTLNKRLTRLRQDKEAQRSRPRFRDRRDRHPAANG